KRGEPPGFLREISADDFAGPLRAAAQSKCRESVVGDRIGGADRRAHGQHQEPGPGVESDCRTSKPGECRAQSRFCVDAILWLPAAKSERWPRFGLHRLRLLVDQAQSIQW